MSCTLSPFGTYADIGECNANEVCGNRWRCARDGDLDANGNQIPLGTPVSVSAADGGEFDTPEECLCYTCNAQQDVGLCEPTDGVQGEHATASCGDTCSYGYACDAIGNLVWQQGGNREKNDTCLYVADGAGGKRLASEGEEGVKFDELKTYSCSPDSIVPEPTPDGQVGVRNKEEECLYTCVSGVKKLSEAGTNPTALHCYDCVDGADTPIAVSGLNGQVDENTECKYTCTNGTKTYLEGGESGDVLMCYRCEDHSGSGMGVPDGYVGPDSPYPVSGMTSGNISSGEEGACKYTCEVDGEQSQSTKVFSAGGKDYSSLECYSCEYDPDDVSASATSVPVSGTDGNVSFANTQCLYTCDAESKPTYSAEGVGPSDIKCYECDGTAGHPTAKVGLREDGSAWNYRHGDAVCAYTCRQGVKTAVELAESNIDPTWTEANPENLYCYTCFRENAFDPVQTGKGEYVGNEAGGCRYWCDADGQTVPVPRVNLSSANDTNSKPRRDDVGCYTCSGAPGPDSACETVEAYMVGQYKTEGDCGNDEAKKCGWGYGCVANKCELNRFADRGRSEEECKMDSTEQCGWGYGCFDKYACVDGVMCANVPSTKCTSDGGPHVCYDSMTDCIGESVCTSMPIPDCVTSTLEEGEWTLQYDEGKSVMDASRDNVWDDNFYMYEGNVVDGFTFYNSSLRPGNTVDAISIGLKDVIEEGVRNVYLRAGGYIRVVNANIRWSMPGGARLIASWTPQDPEFTQCFSLDSIDLAQVCGGDEDECLVREDGVPIKSMILQRVGAACEGGVNRNVLPGVECECPPGFVLNENGSKCELCTLPFAAGKWGLTNSRNDKWITNRTTMEREIVNDPSEPYGYYEMWRPTSHKANEPWYLKLSRQNENTYTFFISSTINGGSRIIEVKQDFEFGKCFDLNTFKDSSLSGTATRGIAAHNNQGHLHLRKE